MNRTKMIGITSIVAMCVVLIVGGYCYVKNSGTITRSSTQSAEGSEHSSSTAIPSIAPYTSSVDFDGDGIDDQTDFLQGVRDYIAQNPQYKSEYYATGYPDDGYGVCTDVVAFGARAAGYDLMNLVYEDEIAHPEFYNLETPDPNIDFRRVPNLNTYFANNAISLTTDTSRIDQWQRGDIIVYSNHVGVVSDKRNDQGIPFLIHHVSASQQQYEENALATFPQEIIGHYRIS